MILIHPPVSKPCEPPPGIARLAGALNSRGIRVRVLDANLEALMSCLKVPPIFGDTWTSRAYRHLQSHLSVITSPDGYKSAARYRHAVLDLNRLFEMSARSRGIQLGLANYQDPTLSPIRSQDLLKAAEDPERNPFYPYFSKRLLGIVEEDNPPTVGFSLGFLSQALCTFAMMGFLRRRWPGVRLILGGGLVTSWMKKPGWQNPFAGLVDHIIAGPGEGPLLSILDAFPSNGHFRPDYSGLAGYPYLAPGHILPYSASSGCYWQRCSFCPERAEGNAYHSLPPHRVTADLLALVRERKPVLVHFLDNAVSPALLKALIEEPPGVPWYGFARITPQLADQDFCLALRRSGCVMLKLGLESGDQKVLDELEKGIDLGVASIALRSLKKARIATYAYLLFGTPAEDLIGARRTLDFTLQHADEIDFLNLALFNMPAYGPESERYETSLFYDGDLSLYRSYVHPAGWDRPLVRQFLDKELRRHPIIARILRKDPPIFTSNHAPFFAKHEGETHL